MTVFSHFFGVGVPLALPAGTAIAALDAIVAEIRGGILFAPAS
jgi:hypothetical protein